MHSYLATEFNYLDQLEFNSEQSELKVNSTKQRRLNFCKQMSLIRKSSEQEYHHKLLEYLPINSCRSKTKISNQAFRGIWYTDSHLLCRRSDAAALIHALHHNLSRSAVAVSVGDEFDFAWAEVSDPITKAIEFKSKLALKYPDCVFHTVAGNHDGCQEYLHRLKLRSVEIPNIVVHEFAVRIGEYIFTHGDCIHWECASIQDVRLYRKKFNQGWSPNLFERIFDRITQELGLHCQIPTHILEQIIPRTMQARRIIKFLKLLDANILTGAKKICFGHTHKGFHGFEFQGLKFSNGGAHERGFKPAIHRFCFRTDLTQLSDKIY